MFQRLVYQQTTYWNFTRKLSAFIKIINHHKNIKSELGLYLPLVCMTDLGANQYSLNRVAPLISDTYWVTVHYPVFLSPVNMLFLLHLKDVSWNCGRNVLTMTTTKVYPSWIFNKNVGNYFKERQAISFVTACLYFSKQLRSNVTVALISLSHRDF